MISSLIDDKHSSVRRMAISSAAKNKLKPVHRRLNLVCHQRSRSTLLVASLLVTAGGDVLEKACKDSNPKVRKSIAETLRLEVTEVDERIDLIAGINLR